MIGFAGVEAIRYSGTHLVTVLPSAEGWCTINVQAIRNWDVSMHSSGINRQMLVWMMLTVRQGGLFYMICRFRGKVSDFTSNHS